MCNSVRLNFTDVLAHIFPDYRAAEGQPGCGTDCGAQPPRHWARAALGAIQ